MILIAARAGARRTWHHSGDDGTARRSHRYRHILADTQYLGGCLSVDPVLPLRKATGLRAGYVEAGTTGGRTREDRSPAGGTDTLRGTRVPATATERSTAPLQDLDEPSSTP